MNREEARDWTLQLYRSYLPGEPDAYDAFLELLDLYCPDEGRALDLGCGDEGYLSFLMRRAVKIIGIDFQETGGPYSRYIQADLNRDLPVEAGSVDMAACKFLIEHLEDPDRFLRETLDALRRGGHLVIMTPNVIYYPYGLNYTLSRVLSQEKRMRLVEAFSGRPCDDIFPVYYRCNTPSRMRRALEQTGFDVVHLRTYGDPLVSAVTRPLGAVAVAYEKIVRLLGVENARGFIVAAARKRQG